ncbi:MAG: CaiB/BaiF CoA transferase family protein [Geminicoccaceae bacterium]
MRPLTGLRVLAFEQYGAGPFGTQYLADLGAEVIKVEQAGTSGDYLRALGPYFVGGEQRDSASGLFFQALNRNKKSITLDLLSEQGRGVLHRLVGSADATADNLRGDVPQKLGLTYNHLKEAKATIVCAHCSAYGREGPRASWPGYDYLMQAEAGYFELCGEPEAAPARFGLSIVDYMAGQSMALGLVSAVMNARETGLGRDVDVNLFDTALFNLSYLASWALNTGYKPGRSPRSAHPSVVPCQLYRTADSWIYLMCNKESFWATLCDLIDRPDLGEDQRFTTFPGRLEHRDLLTELLDEALGIRTTAAWLDRFRGRIPAAPILSPREALENPFLEGRGSIQSLADQDGRAFDVLSSPIRTGDDDDRSNDRGAPLLGEDTSDVLESVGYSKAEIEQLRSEGVV